MAYQIPYVCRHTRAAELLSTGVDPGDAARELGHSLDMFYKTYTAYIDQWADKKDRSRFEGHSEKIGPKLGQKPKNST